MSTADTLEILSLGGCGGFGMNATLFRAAGATLLVDFGIGFPHEGLPGIERLAPDPSPILSRFPTLDGIVVTHAHDDHVGGLPYLPSAWRRAPVWGTPLTIAAARDRMADSGVPEPDFVRVDAGTRLRLAPFEIEFVHVAHSTPQSCALAIDTPAGLVFHTGDIKLDPSPIVGPPTDEAALDRCRERGVELLLLDSTGSLRAGRSGSESTVAAGLLREVERAEGQLFCTLFSSHVDRVQSLLDAARATDRRVALLGRRLQTMFRHGIDLGLIDVPTGIVVRPEEMQGVERARRLWLVGGCQGELGSTLSRISFQDDSRARLEPGDTVVFSSSVIPGNEPLVSSLFDRLLRLGAKVVHADEHRDLHVSGHGSRDELREIVERLAPASVVPVHGSRRHLERTAKIARDAGVLRTAIVERGEPLRVTAGSLEPGPREELPPLHVDSEGRVHRTEEIAARRRTARGGVAVASVRLARRSPPQIEVTVAGVAHPDQAAARAKREIARLLEDSRRRRGRDGDDDLASRIERTAARAITRSYKSRPLVIARLERDGDRE